MDGCTQWTSDGGYCLVSIGIANPKYTKEVIQHEVREVATRPRGSCESMSFSNGRQQSPWKVRGITVEMRWVAWAIPSYGWLNNAVTNWHFCIKKFHIFSHSFSKSMLQNLGNLSISITLIYDFFWGFFTKSKHYKYQWMSTSYYIWTMYAY
jgi:hypothetical protein